MDSRAVPSDAEMNLGAQLQEQQLNSSGSSVSSFASLAFSDIPDDESQTEVTEKDPFERIFYRTQQNESKTTLSFTSDVFFGMFLSKIKADFSSKIDADATTFITKCTTHVHGLKCELVLDSHFSAVEITGIGHRLWRASYFPKVAMSLFKRFVQEVDSQASIEDSSPDVISIGSAVSSSQLTQSEIQQDSGNISVRQPVSESTPTIPRQDHHRSLSSQGQVIFSDHDDVKSNGRKLTALISKINEMESVVCDLKQTVLLLVDNMSKPARYSEMVNKSPTDIQPSDPTSAGGAHAPLADVSRQSPLVAVPFREVNTHAPMVTEEPQPIPVIMNNGNRPARQPQQIPAAESQMPQQDSQTSGGKILLLGDSIISGINPKGLVNTVHKASRSGANVQRLINELDVYDLKSFSTIILYVGGNDASNGDDLRQIQEKYDELLSLIKCRNVNCRVLVCSVAPRGDVNVADINRCLSDLVAHWRNQRVELVQDCHDLFFKEGEVCGRYYKDDSIHLSDSGTKRLLDAVNRKLKIIVDFNSCVYSKRRAQNRDHFNGHAGNGFRANLNGTGFRANQNGAGFRANQNGAGFRANQNVAGFRVNQHGAGFRGNQFRRPAMTFGGNRGRCYGCNLVGHKFADCWYRDHE